MGDCLDRSRSPGLTLDRSNASAFPPQPPAGTIVPRAGWQFKYPSIPPIFVSLTSSAAQVTRHSCIVVCLASLPLRTGRVFPSAIGSAGYQKWGSNGHLSSKGSLGVITFSERQEDLPHRSLKRPLLS